MFATSWMMNKMWSSLDPFKALNLSTHDANAPTMRPTLNVENCVDRNRTYDLRTTTSFGNRPTRSLHSRSTSSGSETSARTFSLLVIRTTEFGLSFKADRSTDNFLSTMAFWRRTGLPDSFLDFLSLLTSPASAFSKLQSLSTWNSRNVKLLMRKYKTETNSEWVECHLDQFNYTA